MQFQFNKINTFSFKSDYNLQAYDEKLINQWGQYEQNSKFLIKNNKNLLITTRDKNEYIYTFEDNKFVVYEVKLNKLLKICESD